MTKEFSRFHPSSCEKTDKSWQVSKQTTKIDRTHLESRLDSPVEHRIWSTEEGEAIFTRRREVSP